jgi:hypothetical protein
MSTFSVADQFVTPEELEQRFDFKAATWVRWAREGQVRSMGLLGCISLQDAERLFLEKDGERYPPTRYFRPSGGQQ